MDEAGSPLARHLAGEAVPDHARAYALVLPEVERVLTRIDDYEFLWRDVWARIAAAMESFERGASKVEEFTDEKLSLITLAPDVHSSAGFKPTKHGAPFTAISRYARGELYLIAQPLGDGWSYRADFPYYSWAETIVRPRVVRRDFSALVARLNELEHAATGEWKIDRSEMSSALKFAGPDQAPAQSGLQPETVAAETRAALREARAPSAVGV
jgi:hypothetical protein